MDLAAGASKIYFREFVNTLMLQDVLDDPTWSNALDRDADRRGLTPLFWSHVLPYGEVRLDMTSRLALGVSSGTEVAQ